MKAFLPVLSLAVVGCAPQTPPEQNLGMANPASVHCVKVGGRLEIRKGTAGDVGYCHLPDGRVVEEWELFRASRGSTKED